MNNGTKGAFCDRSLLLAGEEESIFHSSNDVLRHQLICQVMEVIATVARKDETVSYKNFQDNPGMLLMKLLHENKFNFVCSPFLRSVFKRAYDGAIVSDFPSVQSYRSAFPDPDYLLIREEELFRYRRDLRISRDWTNDVNSHIRKGKNKCKHCCLVLKNGETEDILGSGIPHHPARRISIIKDATKVVNTALGLWRVRNPSAQSKNKTDHDTGNVSRSISLCNPSQQHNEVPEMKRIADISMDDRKIPYLKIKKLELAGEPIITEVIEKEVPKVLSFQESIRLMQNWTLAIKKIESLELRTQFLEGLKTQLPLSSIKFSPDQESKYQMYSLVLQLVNGMMINDIERQKVDKNYNQEIERIFRIFENCVSKDDECKECFKLFQDFCTIFIRPIDHFHPGVIQQIRKLAIKITIPGIHYGYTENAVTETAQQIFKMFDEILSSWKRYQGKFSSGFIFNENLMIKNTISFINDYSKIYALSGIKCTCDNQDCRVKRNFFASAQLNLTALRIVQQYCTTTAIMRIVSSIETVAKSCLESIGELRRLSCAHWLMIWRDFSTSIFNITGRINGKSYSDSIYFYYLLYTYVTEFEDPTEGKSSFGDDSIPPLSNVLYQLSRTHFQHMKYREAMKIAALDAFLHHDNKNCKAFDVWKDILNIYPEARVVNIVDFLKDQSDSIEEMGFMVNLDKVHIPAICLREIEGLQKSKDINLAPSMLSALEFIDSMKDQILYDRGIDVLRNYLRSCS